MMIWFAYGATGASRRADPTAPELAQALQKKYDAVKDFSADFAHTYAAACCGSRSPSAGA